MSQSRKTEHNTKVSEQEALNQHYDLRAGDTEHNIRVLEQETQLNTTLRSQSRRH